MRNERVCLPEFVLGLVDHPERPDIGPDLADLARARERNQRRLRAEASAFGTRRGQSFRAFRLEWAKNLRVPVLAAALAAAQAAAGPAS
jgi:hypothetical protein